MVAGGGAGIGETVGPKKEVEVDGGSVGARGGVEEAGGGVEEAGGGVEEAGSGVEEAGRVLLSLSSSIVLRIP